MYIKSIHVQGFKTYDDQRVELDPGHNVFVGRNGSGKSNFFEAIRFVFGDDFDQLRAQDRQSILHQSKSDTTVNASVSIVLDNSDQRIPNTEGSEIKLTRLVGLKKDEYFVNAKRSTKAEVVQLLDMAGLSSSNPYYVVQQGKVSSLAKMSDEERLQLLQEVAGTRVYETRRTESLRTMEDSKRKAGDISAMMADMDVRMSELLQESKELEQYNSLERKRRAIEYVLYSNELEKSSDALKELEEGRDTGTLAGLRTGTETAQAEAAAALAALAAKRDELRALTGDAASAKKSLPKLQEKRVKLAERVSNLRAAVANDQLGADEAHKELTKVQAEIAAKRKELEAGEPSFRAAQAALDAARTSALALEQRMNALSDKAGRAGKFKSKKERDAYLLQAVSATRGELSKSQSSLSAAEKEASLQAEKSKKAGAEALALEKAGQDKSKELASLSSGLDGQGSAKAAAISKAHAAKAKLDDCEKRSSELAAKLSATESSVYANMPYALRKGLEEVAKVADPKHPAHIQGIHGPLYELIKTTHERYNVPVEAVAGPELFNVVVQDEQVAAKVISHLLKVKAGRVTCIPLTRVKASEQTYPQADDCRPLMQFLQFNPDFTKAVKQQFGRVLLCKNSEVAARYACEHGFVCVTLEGDTANNSGVLTGGYINPVEARLKNVSVRAEIRSLLNSVTADKVAVEQEVAAAEANVKAAVAAGADVEEKVRRLRDDVGRIAQDAEKRRRDADSASKKAADAEREVIRLRQAVELLQARVTDLEAEMKTELNSKLTPADASELEKATGALEAAKDELLKSQSAFEKQRSTRQTVSTQLEDNLLKRANELQKRIARGASASGTESQDELRDLDSQLQSTSASESQIKASLESLQEKINQKEAEIAQQQEQYNLVNTKAVTLSEELREQELEDEKYLEKKRAVLHRKEDAANKLRDLGTLPTAEVEKYQKIKRKALVEELGQVHEQLKKLQHVNKRSSSEYETVTTQRRELEERYSHLYQEEQTIHELVESLDAKKDEKIMTTFKGVQKHFKEIFAELVPRGSAELTLLTVDDMEDNAKDSRAAKSKKENRIDRFVGVGIKASFSDASSSGSKSLLSGGQHTIVALALIFAIQRADPAPFYILDEVDAALDPTHRSAVGAMIKKQTSGDNGVQFVTSSFWEEFLDYGDKWFGVSMARTASSIEELNQQEAVAFVLAARKDEGKAQPAPQAQNSAKRTKTSDTAQPPGSEPRSRA